MASKTGPQMFADLTANERRVLSDKLSSGWSAAFWGVPDPDLGVAQDINGVALDVTAPWRKNGAE